MSYEVECFDNIIGLSRTICECYDEGRPEDYNLSLSGFYLDELYPLTAYKGLLNCENGNDIWQLLARSREQAILTFRTDANVLLLRDNKLRRKVFKGKIGKLKYTAEEIITTGDWVGIRMICDNVVGGKLKIKKIGTLFGQTGAFNLYVYNNLNELEQIIPLTTQANTHKINDITDLELDLHNDYTDNLEYFFIYQKNGLTPKNNSIKDDCIRACSESQTNKQFGYMDWSSVNGFKRTDISDLSDLSYSSSDKMYGLTFDLEFTCSVENVWCEEELDFVSDNITRAIALAIRYKAGELFFYDNLLSSNVNFNRLVNGDAIQQAKEEFAAKYAEIMTFIVDNIDVTITDCFECEDRIKIGRNLIQS